MSIEFRSDRMSDVVDVTTDIPLALAFLDANWLRFKHRFGGLRERPIRVCIIRPDDMPILGSELALLAGGDLDLVAGKWDSARGAIHFVKCSRCMREGFRFDVVIALHGGVTDKEARRMVSTDEASLGVVMVGPAMDAHGNG